MATADSNPYSLTYSGIPSQIETTGTDSIGQHCAVMKTVGDDAGGNMHFAIRRSGPYGISDGQLIRDGTGADQTFIVANAIRQYVLVKDLLSSTNYYWGATFDAGAASTAAQFTTKAEPTLDTGLTPEGIQP